MATPKRKPRIDLYSLEEEYPAEPTKKYYHIEFQNEIKRDINAYELRTFLNKEANERIEKLTTDSKDGFSFLVNITEHTEKLTEITKFEEYDCKITPHKYLNQIKGVLYIYEYEFNDQFGEHLKMEYPFVEEVIEATFMKPKNKQATALLLTFNLDTLPYSLYIPGERSDSIVYPYHDRPMICHKCYRYGHTKTRCTKEKVCRKCGSTDHSIDHCENDFNCPNCGGEHIAGSRECDHEQRERKIKEIQAKERVGRRRAMQILTGEEEFPATKQTTFPTHFSWQMDSEQKRKFNLG